MNIWKKTGADIAGEIRMVEIDFQSWTINSDLLWALTPENYATYLHRSKQLRKQRNIFERDGILVLRAVDKRFLAVRHLSQHPIELPATIIELGDYAQRLHIHENIKNGKINDLKIFSHYNDEVFELPIPPEDRRNIIVYLRDGEPFPDFDCKHFLHDIKWMNSIENLYGSRLNASQWRLSKKNPSKLVPGECVMLVSELHPNHLRAEDIQHYAYYLWDGLYISKFWRDWGICITSLEKMHEFFWTKEFLCMKPKSTD